MAGGLGEALAARPRGALATGSALLAGTLALALGAPERLPAGPIQVEGGAAPAEFVVRARDPRGAPALPADSRVRRIALDVISSRLRADPAVERVEAARSREHADLVVTLAPDGWSERLAAVRRIAASIDPGPLDVSLRGQIAELDERREAVGGELWRLEFAALPLLVLALVGTLGLRMALAALGAAALGIGGCAAGLRLLAEGLDISSAGLLAGAPVALLVAIEATAMLAAHGRASGVGSAGSVPGVPAGVAVSAAALVTPLALLATPVEQVASVALGCGLAAAMAMLGVALFGTWATAQAAGAGPTPPDAPAGTDSWRAHVAMLAATTAALGALGALAHAALARPPAGEMLGIAPATAGEAVAVSGAIGAVLAVVGGRTALTLKHRRGGWPSPRSLARGFALSTVALLLTGGALAAGGVILGSDAEPEVELYGALVAGGALGDLLLLRAPGMLLAARGRRAGVAAAG